MDSSICTRAYNRDAVAYLLDRSIQLRIMHRSIELYYQQIQKRRGERDIWENYYPSQMSRPLLLHNSYLSQMSQSDENV